MQRLEMTPRPDWQERVEAQGLTFHLDGAASSHWNEAAAYVMSEPEIETIEKATAELHRLCLQAVAYLGSHPRELDCFAIPPSYRSEIVRSIRRHDPSLYGRMDLAYDGVSPPKLLEYNADTPTGVIETAVVQWHWLTDTHPAADQFNRLHEALIERWQVMKPSRAAPLHLSAMDDAPEDRETTRYLQDLALQAGWGATYLPLQDVGWDRRRHRFVDAGDRPIETWFKLYPWEWVAADPFGRHVPGCDLRILEPAWKMLLSNKAILSVLWRLNPGHPNLLPASFSRSDVGPSCFAKPILAREGANITALAGDKILQKTEGPYAGTPVIYQEAGPVFRSGGRRAVLGSWMVGDEPAGMMVREDDGLIIGNRSCIVPHLIAG